jgi:hypothetical protein
MKLGYQHLESVGIGDSRLECPDVATQTFKINNSAGVKGGSRS